MRQGLLNSSRLRYSPPTLVEPYVWNVASGTGFQQLKCTGELVGRDIEIVLPAINRLRGISVIGSPRHVSVIGGSIDLSQAGSNKVETPFRVYGASGTEGPTGTIYVEGLYLNGGGADIDLMDLGGSTKSPFGVTTPTVIVQNVRAENMIGTVESPTHPDGLQLQGATRDVFTDKLTIYTGYQGIIGTGSSHVPLATMTLNRTNIGYWVDGEGIHANGFLIYAWNVGEQFPMYFGEGVYLDPSTSGRNVEDSLFFPGENSEHGIVSTDGGKTLHLNSPNVSTGSIVVGPPPGGDWVPKENVGLGYVTPGYR